MRRTRELPESETNRLPDLSKARYCGALNRSPETPVESVTMTCCGQACEQRRAAARMNTKTLAARHTLRRAIEIDWFIALSRLLCFLRRNTSRISASAQGG